MPSALMPLSTCSLVCILQARTRKLEAESKLAGLQKDLAELGTVSGDSVEAEEAQTLQLQQVHLLLDCSHHQVPL